MKIDEPTEETIHKAKSYSYITELKQLLTELKKGTIEENELPNLRKTLIKAISTDIGQIANKIRRKNIIIDYITAVIGKEYKIDDHELEKEIRHFLRSLERR